VNPDESKIQSARRVMNALIKCTAAMAKHLAWEGVNTEMHRITAELLTYHVGINFKDSLALALAQHSNGFKISFAFFITRL
ncbi:MAG TPA: hypothetical protein PLC81_06185, partial [Bacteroidales bacterium]|nr:hypothetical protein [Bacteroidales bacterium]